jgi:hypothetical protein
MPHGFHELLISLHIELYLHMGAAHGRSSLWKGLISKMAADDFTQRPAICHCVYTKLHGHCDLWGHRVA